MHSSEPLVLIFQNMTEGENDKPRDSLSCPIGEFLLICLKYMLVMNATLPRTTVPRVLFFFANVLSMMR